MATKTTLKSYFETGDSPTQAQFSILIDSLLGIDEEVADNLTTDSGVQALAARQGVALKAVVDALGIRVGSIEELNSTTLNDYLLKADLGGYLVGKSDTNHTHLASSITDLLDLVYTKAQVQDLVDNHASSAHTHQISEVAGLQTALDNANDSSLVAQAKSELETSISGKADLSHGHTESEISDLKNYIESATATLLLQGKSDIGHTHSESSISDLDKYSKAEVDSLFAGVVSDGSVPAHTHTEANISDLDKYSKAEADQKIEDGKTTMLVGHLAESNPHNITKADVGLGNVDNLSKVSLFSDPAFSGALNGAISGISKASISLGNVPNVDVQSLLQAHLNDEDNPHKVALSDFDTYSRAQTDSQIQTLIEIYRTVHTGTLPEEGTGSTGLVTQRDLWDRVKDITYDVNSDTTSINGNFVVTGEVSLGGTMDVPTAKVGDVSISGGTVSSLSQLRLFSENSNVLIDDDVNINGKLGVVSLFSAPQVSIGNGGAKILGGVSIGGSLNVGGASNFYNNITLGNSTDTDPPDLVVWGDLTVHGENTILNTSQLDIEDNIIKLNKNVTGTPTLDAGIEVERGTATNAQLFWDESDDTWKLNIGGTIKTIAFNEDLTTHTSDTSNPHTVTKTQVGLGSVENTALSTWAGSGKITKLGTIVSGTVPSTNTSGFHTVATSGNYTDISGTPTTASLLSNITAVEGVPTSSASYDTSTLKFSIPRGSQITNVTASTVTPAVSASAADTKDSNGDVSIALNIPRGTKISSVTASGLEAGATPTAQLGDDANGDQTIAFGVPKGDKGQTGDAFVYNDFTTAQLAGLKGARGDAFVYSDFSDAQLAGLKGADGTTPSFTYDEGTKTLAIKNS